ncbi:MAG: hypothetical protein EPN97_17945 [Alphaproteobacteria bacterium]|nr:MAG: hypothetical protein EPN97_17945 [Alphaproteobacteria bacterium]
MEQKAWRTKITYRLFDAYVEYTIIDSRGDKASFSAKYEELPSRFDYRTFEPKRPILAVQLVTLMALALMLILINPNDSLPLLGSVAVYGAFVIGISALLRRRPYFRRLYTSLPTRNGKLLILCDARHDDILHEIEARRLKALRKFAMVDALNAPYAELKRLRWLKEEGAITAEEFANYRRALSVAAGGAVFPEADESRDGPPLTLAQDSFRFHAQFAFHGDHLEYSMNDGAQTAFNIKYGELPHPTEYRTFMRNDGLAALVLCLCMLVALALIDTYSGEKYFATAEGFRQTVLGMLIFIPAVVFLVFGARRYSRKEFTILPVTKGVIRVLQDPLHDRLIGEMKQRRYAALRAQAVIDRANSPQGELRKFTWLKEQGAITEKEFEAFRNKLLEAISDRPSQPPRPPTETVH